MKNDRVIHVTIHIYPIEIKAGIILLDFTILLAKRLLSFIYQIIPDYEMQKIKVVSHSVSHSCLEDC